MFHGIMNEQVNPIKHGISKLQTHMEGGYYSPNRLKSILLPKYGPLDSQTSHTPSEYHSRKDSWEKKQV